MADMGLSESGLWYTNLWQLIRKMRISHWLFGSLLLDSATKWYLPWKMWVEDGWSTFWMISTYFPLCRMSVWTVVILVEPGFCRQRNVLCSLRTICIICQKIRSWSSQPFLQPFGHWVSSRGNHRTGRLPPEPAACTTVPVPSRCTTREAQLRHRETETAP